VYLRGGSIMYENPKLKTQTLDKLLKFICIFTLFILIKDSYFVREALATSPTVKEVLIIASYDSNDRWENALLNGIYDVLDEEEFKVLYKVENLSLSNKDSSYFQTQAQLLKFKYEKSNFDLIIALDDEALDFASTYNSQIFRGTPVIYGGINDSSKLSQYPYNTFTGAIEQHNAIGLIDFILANHKEAKEINLLLDNSIFSFTIENDIKTNCPYYLNKIKFNFLKSDYLKDIKEMLNNYTSSQINIVVGTFKIDNDFVPTANDSIEELKRCSNCKVYTLNSRYLNSNIIGGHVTSGVEHGKTIGKVASKILHGETINSITPTYDSSGSYVFNYNELKLNNISRDKLPKNSIILNSPLRHGRFFRFTLFFLTTLVVLCIVIITYQTVGKAKNRKIADAERKRYEEVVKYDKMKTEFLANISHELRTPLNVMLSALQLLDVHKENGDILFKSSDIPNNLGYIKQNSYRLLRLINNLIDVTKIDAGFFQLHLENKNIVHVVEDITLSIAEYIESKGINLIFDTNEEEKYTAMDSDKIERIILNLLSNAIKFTPSGGTIFVDVFCNDTKVSVSVKDSGIGIPKDKQEFIFDRFTQIDSSLSRNGEGSGIGLSLVKSLVELHNGKIYLESELDKGATFTFELPIVTVEETSALINSSLETIQPNHNEKIILEFSDI
jgi:signal transduction histidine kinase/ABC-type uncharacterized transport system substrate-binding protein